MKTAALIAHNLRSTHNVGSLLRTAEGLGVRHVYLTGYTPYPLSNTDTRLPHLAAKLHSQIHKTALGAEDAISWSHHDDIADVIALLKQDDFTVCAVEQAKGSLALPDYAVPDKFALIVGREVDGIEPDILKLCDHILEIPMFGKKESFNVVQAAAMVLYHWRFGP